RRALDQEPGAEYREAILLDSEATQLDGLIRREGDVSGVTRSPLPVQCPGAEPELGFDRVDRPIYRPDGGAAAQAGEPHDDGRQLARDNVVGCFGAQEVIDNRPTRRRPTIVELPDQRPGDGSVSGTAKAAAPATYGGAESLGLHQLRGVHGAIQISGGA